MIPCLLALPLFRTRSRDGVYFGNVGEVHSKILTAVRDDRVYISAHAVLRMRQRRILLWQITTGTLDGRLLVERPEALPNPTAEIEILLPDGVNAKAVWSWLGGIAFAKLVTIHFLER